MSHPSRVRGYATVLALPGAARMLAASTLARSSYALVPLAMLLAIAQSTGSYARAGAALGLYGAATLSMPFKARLVDRLGLGLVLPALAGVYAGSLVAVVLALEGPDRSSVLLLPAVAAAGLSAPPMGPTCRALWTALTTPGAQRRLAYSLDTTVEELLFVLGPLVVGVTAATTGPAVLLLAGAAANLLGTIALVRTRPARAISTTRAAPEVDDRATHPRRTALRRAAGSLAQPGVPALVLVVLGVGLGAGPLEVAVLAQVEQAGTPAAIGVLLAVLSLGGILGGLAWGALPHTGLPHVTQLAGLALVAAAALAAAAVAPAPLGLAAALLVAGAALTPLVITAYLAADTLAGGRGVENTTWVTTANNAGLSAGTALGGLLVDQTGPSVTLLVGAAVVAVVAVGSGVRGRAGAQPPPHVR